MLPTFPALLLLPFVCFSGQLAAIRPPDAGREGPSALTSPRAPRPGAVVGGRTEATRNGGVTETLAVGHSAALVRESARKRLQLHSSPTVVRSALAETAALGKGDSAAQHAEAGGAGLGAAGTAKDRRLAHSSGAGRSERRNQPSAKQHSHLGVTSPGEVSLAPGPAPEPPSSTEELAKGDIHGTNQPADHHEEIATHVPHKEANASTNGNAETVVHSSPEALASTIDSLPDDVPLNEIGGSDIAGDSTDESSEGAQEANDIIEDLEELETIAGKVWGKVSKFLDEEIGRHVVLNLVIYLSAVFIAMGLYFMCFRQRDVFSEQEFRFGLCDCFGDVRVCLCGLCCPAIRWADTVSTEKGGFLVFGAAFFVFCAVLGGLSLLCLYPLAGGVAWFAFATLGMYYRQQIRQKYDLENDTAPSYIEDFCVWCCCAFCALCQEARQVDADFDGDDFEGRRSRVGTSW